MRAFQSRFIDFLPYQLAFGFTLRWHEGPHFRLYLGPLKVHV